MFFLARALALLSFPRKALGRNFLGLLVCVCVLDTRIKANKTRSTGTLVRDHRVLKRDTKTISEFNFRVLLLTHAQKNMDSKQGNANVSHRHLRESVERNLWIPGILLIAGGEVAHGCLLAVGAVRGGQFILDGVERIPQLLSKSSAASSAPVADGFSSDLLRDIGTTVLKCACIGLAGIAAKKIGALLTDKRTVDTVAHWVYGVPVPKPMS